MESSPSYASVLGLKKIPGDKEWFDKSVIEFFTKLENKDRLLSLQEAHRISGLTPEMFKDLLELVQLISLALFHIFAELGIELWDGKLEFAQVNEQLMLVDSIGPDELRLQVKGQNLSKEFIRQFYRHSKWFIAVHEAQKIAKEQGRIDWKELCQQTLQAVPEPLPENLKVLAQQLYTVLTNTLLGEDLFSHQPSLQELAELISHSTGQKQHAC